MDDSLKVLVGGVIDSTQIQNEIATKLSKLKPKINVEIAFPDNVSQNLDKVTSSTKKVTSGFKEVKTANEDLKRSFSDQASQSAKQMDAMASKLAQFKTYLESLSKLNKDNGLKESANNILANGLSGNYNTSDISKQITQFKAYARELGATKKTLLQTMSDSAQKFIQWIGVGTIVMQTVNMLRNVVTEVTNIDTAMVELKKVTDASSNSFNSFLSGAKQNAVKLGVTVSDLINATSNFSRLGYSLKDATNLGQVATIYKNVGDDVNNISQASGSIISTLKAFNIQASDSISIVDKFNEVGNKFAISSGGIGDALQRSASSLSAAGNTIDQAIGMITAANTVVQDPDSVGVAFKTLALRIRGAKTELESAGGDVDGMAESTAKLQKEVKALSGVDIMKNSTTFKSTYAILDELSAKWKNLTDIQQASLTELMAGKRQGNVFSAIMNNFDIARKAANTAEDSAGSAMKEENTWLESIEAKQQKAQAAFQSFSDSFLNSGLVKGFFDAQTGILGFLTNVNDKLGALPVVAATASAALSGIKNVGKPNMPSYARLLLCA